MNILRATSRLLSKSHIQFNALPSIRGAIYLDEHWMPGPYPKTEAERLAAAKKYNLLPEEYQAYDPEKWEFAYGDYPQLPNICYHDCDPYYAWDYPALGKDYGAVWHVNSELYGNFGLTLNRENHIPFSEVFWTYVIAISTVFYVMYLIEYKYECITMYKPMHRIHPGEVYYHYPSSNLKVYE